MDNDAKEFMMYAYIVVAISFIPFIYIVIQDCRKKRKIRNDRDKMLKTLEESDCPWSKESLKHKYLIEQLSSNKHLGIFSNMSKFICPNCFKSVLIKKIYLSCPYCDEEFGYKNDNSNLNEESNSSELSASESLFINEVRLRNSIFSSCAQCGGIIRHVKCYHCDNKIDLFAPYDEEKLEAQRYV